MGVLAGRRYLFRRRPIRGRVAFALLICGLAYAVFNLVSAELQVGGYQRSMSTEEPAA